jgi:tRNA U34 2-thiouridine synthase MnmA/TrmU
VINDQGVVDAVELRDVAYGIAAGQELVMFVGDRVVGSARIRSAAR